VSRAFCRAEASEDACERADGENVWLAYAGSDGSGAKSLTANTAACDDPSLRLGAYVQISYCNYLSAFPVACVETSLSGVVQLTNDDAAQLLNVASACLVNKPLVHFVARGDCNIFRAAVECVGGGKELDRVVVRFRPRRGASVARIALSGRRLDRMKPRRIVWVLHRA
jgi:hypothetical protein